MSLIAMLRGAWFALWNFRKVRELVYRAQACPYCTPQELCDHHKHQVHVLRDYGILPDENYDDF